MRVWIPPSSAALAGVRPRLPLIRQSHVEIWLRGPLGSVLDYGCGIGELIERLRRVASRLRGVDVDADALRCAARPEGAELRQISSRDSPPFPDESFDAVILRELPEHVADERGALCECARVLKPAGRLLITTPRAGLLTAIDPGNLTFVFPRWHERVHTEVLHDAEYFERRFGPGRRRALGMVADFTADQRPRHRHYTFAHLRALVPNALETVAHAAYFPAMRRFWALQVLRRVLSHGCQSELPRRLFTCYAALGRCEGWMGDQLVVLLRRRVSAW